MSEDSALKRFLAKPAVRNFLAIPAGIGTFFGINGAVYFGVKLLISMNSEEGHVLWFVSTRWMEHQGITLLQAVFPGYWAVVNTFKVANSGKLAFALIVALPVVVCGGWMACVIGPLFGGMKTGDWTWLIISAALYVVVPVYALWFLRSGEHHPLVQKMGVE